MTDSHAEASILGIYLYCLARPECLPLVRGPAEQDLRGVDERYPVGALEEAGVVAVIGDVDSGEFCDQNMQNLPWVAPRACRHEAVVERIMGASPVLPVKFGTIFRSRTRLMEFLGRHREGIVRVLDDLRDKSEWSVKGYLVEEQARRIVTATDLAIQSRLAALSTSPGVRYLQQKQLDAEIGAALRLWVARVTHDLNESLAPHAVASTELRCHTSAVTGRPERMVFNCSFLVTPEALPDFRAAFSDQQHAHESTGLTLELRGPWPPYNFCPTLSEGKT
ncbi:MAG: GvpL/GvpF family gas vesicle protein [Betaproteobacteria bacterium]|nr:GvpL/GvpF family gas vesicle protein [Betaproteobacteria bacterium]